MYTLRFPTFVSLFLTLALSFAAVTVHAQGLNLKAHLTGSEEVPLADTRAQGQAIFRVSNDGTSIHFRLNVANIENVTQAHIHLAPAGQNGPVVAWLYPSGPPAVLLPGRFQGVLSAGVITEASLVGPLAGQTLDQLISQMMNGNTYVNVHTASFPAGEIRGQIQ
ncbi:MAG: CHRD domain-containing protein [Aquisalimonadaceae bacterium]